MTDKSSGQEERDLYKKKSSKVRSDALMFEFPKLDLLRWKIQKKKKRKKEIESLYVIELL